MGTVQNRYEITVMFPSRRLFLWLGGDGCAGQSFRGTCGDEKVSVNYQRKTEGQMIKRRGFRIEETEILDSRFQFHLLGDPREIRITCSGPITPTNSRNPLEIEAGTYGLLRKTPRTVAIAPYGKRNKGNILAFPV